MATMSLITINDFKNYIGLDSTSEDEYLTILVSGVCDSFKRLVGWEVAQQTYTHYFDGNWSSEIALFETPVMSVTSVYLDNNGYDGQSASPFPASTLLTPGVDYYLKLDRSLGGSASGLLVKIGNVWPGQWSRPRGDLTPRRVFSQGNIKVTYVAGYYPIPNDIRLALCEACKVLRASRTMPGPLQSEGLGEYNYNTAAVVPPNSLLNIGDMRSIVQTYRRLRLR